MKKDFLIKVLFAFVFLIISTTNGGFGMYWGPYGYQSRYPEKTPRTDEQRQERDLRAKNRGERKQEMFEDGPDRRDYEVGSGMQYYEGPEVGYGFGGYEEEPYSGGQQRQQYDEQQYDEQQYDEQPNLQFEPEFQPQQETQVRRPDEENQQQRRNWWDPNPNEGPFDMAFLGQQCGNSLAAASRGIGGFFGFGRGK